ncbi:MAG: 3-deoxy-7-phosphoheptulonate synthase, partial [Phycisphaerales bacterium]
ALARTVEALDPHGTPGRVSLITRLGARDVGRLLPRAIDAGRRSGRAGACPRPWRAGSGGGSAAGKPGPVTWAPR